MLKKTCLMATAAIFLLSCGNKNTKVTDNMDKQTTKQEQGMYMLIGTYTSGESKGIYVYRLDTVAGTSEYISEVEVANPSYLAIDKEEKFVYSVTENDDAESSAANAFSFDKENGKLAFINKQPTQGGAPCYISVDDNRKHVVTANYAGANVTAFGVNDDGSLAPTPQIIQYEGRGKDTDRQKQPHIHCVKYTPDGKYLFVNDLGTDKIHKLDIDAGGDDYLAKGNPESFDVKAGSGPRHIVFHPNNKYAYLITELSGDVIVFEYNDGNLKEIQTIEADEMNAQGSADIHISPDGKFVYASNRLQKDGIAIFSVDDQDGTLTKTGYQPTGIHPRNFAITPNGHLLLVAARDSDKIQVFRRNQETGLLEDTGHDITLDSPVCIKLASLK